MLDYPMASKMMPQATARRPSSDSPWPPGILLLALTLCPFLAPVAVAQTRLYLPSSGAAAVSPAYSAGWDDGTGTADRLAFATSSGGSTAQTLLISTDANNTIDTDQLLRQYVSPPLSGAQSISGDLRGQVKASESSNAQNARMQGMAYVVSNDGLTVRGILFDGLGGSDALSSEFSTNNVNRRFPLAAISPVTVSSVSAQDCDRIVVEFGSRNHSTGTGTLVRMTFGDDSATDLADVNETSTATADPWIEFSQTLSFNVEGPCGSPAARRVIVVN